MDLARPISSVIPGLTGRVLGVLGRTEAPLTGRAVAQALRPAGSQAGVAKVLNELVAHGIVRRSEAGTAAQYVLNRDHLTAPMIESLAELRTTFLERLTAEVEAMRPAPLSAYLYGSAARGDGSAESDIDIALVIPDELDALTAWDEATAELRQRVEAMSGNAVSLVEFRPRELFGTPDHWLPPVLRAEGIRLAGATLDDLVRLWAALDARAKNRAKRLVAAGRYADAAPELGRVVRSYGQLGDRLSEGLTLRDLGEVLFLADQVDKSIDAYEAAAAALRDSGDVVHEGYALAGAGKAYEALRQFQRAQDAYSRALALDVDDLAWRGTVLARLARIESMTGQTRRALATCDEAILLLQQAGDAQGEARTLLLYSDLAIWSDPVAAANAADRAVEMFRALKDRRSTGRALLQLGMAYSLSRRAAESRNVFHEALAVAVESGDRGLEGDALHLLGRSFLRTREWHESVRHLSEAAHVFRELGDLRSAARVLDLLGSAYDREGRQADAIKVYKEAIDAYQRAGDTEGSRRALIHLDRVDASVLDTEAS